MDRSRAAKTKISEWLKSEWKPDGSPHQISVGTFEGPIAFVARLLGFNILESKFNVTLATIILIVSTLCDLILPLTQINFNDLKFSLFLCSIANTGFQVKIISVVARRTILTVMIRSFFYLIEDLLQTLSILP